jgi:hypothetical protein
MVFFADNILYTPAGLEHGVSRCSWRAFSYNLRRELNSASGERGHFQQNPAISPPRDVCFSVSPLPVADG